MMMIMMMMIGYVHYCMNYEVIQFSVDYSHGISRKILVGTWLHLLAESMQQGPFLHSLQTVATS